MANRLFTSQFVCSFEKQLVKLLGAFTVTSGITRATLSISSGKIILTSVAYGTAGNAITIALVNPGADHALAVAVVGNAITVTLAYATGAITSTYDDVLAALQANSSVTALATVTGAGGSGLVTALAATPLAGGAASVITSNIPINFMSLSETTTPGIYTLSLTDAYAALLGCSFTLQTASAVDRTVQLSSVDVASAKTIGIRTLAGATPTSIPNGDTIYIELSLRNIR